ncbi:MAG: glycine cleavage system protein T [Gammaproteobacteria bacterium]|nr:glycine cleavage system protein T [Gammaproteobacteria bacterium]
MEIFQTTRLRCSPFYDATIAAGAEVFSVYNRMLLPCGYGDAEAEYWRLLRGVSMWDVAVQRQVELRGADAGRLAQILTTRDISTTEAGRGKYAPLCSHNGVLINDPVLLKLADDRYWLSIADSDILFWARAVAAERGLNARIFEPDVSPLALQGPKAEEVAAAIFGDWVRELKFFAFRETQAGGIPLIVARSGWSKQGGFELYLTDGSRGGELWNLVSEAGRPWDIGPGYPNGTERIESGLLSWGGDTDDATNPYEVRLGKYVDLDVGDEVIGIKALREIHARGAARHQLGLLLDGDEPSPPHALWYSVRRESKHVGDMTCGTWSPRLKRNIGFALLARDILPGARVEVLKDGDEIGADVVELPFL